MKITKRTLISFSIISLFCLIQAIGVFGLANRAEAISLWERQLGMEDGDDIGEAFGVDSGEEPTDFRTVVAEIVNIFLGFMGVIFLVLMLWGGWKWMTSQGNESTIDDAKSLIKAAVIGLVIIIMSYGIAQMVMNYAYDISVND